MDDFLTKLYEEEMDKTAGAELDEFMATLPTEELEAFLKIGGKMSLQTRESLPTKAFAVPESKAKKIGVSGEIKGEAKGKYPIPDMKHARNALARVSQHGTPAEREAVRRKVYAKFPGLKEGFQERHGGASPTSKENVKKVEQGGIRKAAVAGSAEPPLPNAAQGKEMDAKQQEARKNVDQEHNSNPPPRHEDTRTTNQVSKEAMVVGDQVGRLFAKLAMGKFAQEEPQPAPVGERAQEGKEEESGKVKEDAFTTPGQKAKAKILSTAMKAGAGKPAAQRKAMVSAAAGKLKSAQGDDEMETTAGAKIEAVKGFLGKLRGGFGAGRQIAKEKATALKDIGEQASEKALRQHGGLGTPAVHRKLVKYEKGKMMPELQESLAKARERVGGGAAGVARHVGEHGKKYLAGAGALTAAEIARRAMKNKEKSAEAKAEIVAKTMRLTRGAPDHVKLAAAALAGRQLTEMSKEALSQDLLLRAARKAFQKGSKAGSSSPLWGKKFRQGSKFLEAAKAK